MYSKFHSGNCANRRSLTSLSKHWSRETEQINPFESSSGTALTSRCLFAADKRFTVSGTAIFIFLIQYFMQWFGKFQCKYLTVNKINKK